MSERAILALGGNLGDRKATIKAAIKDINAIDGVTVIAKSPLYESFAATEDGPDEAAPRYLNGVIEIETRSSRATCLPKFERLKQRTDEFA